LPDIIYSVCFDVKENFEDKTDQVSYEKRCHLLCQVEYPVTVTSGSHIQYVMATNGFVGVSGVHSKIDKRYVG
jgi:hypothetical protein